MSHNKLLSIPTDAEHNNDGTHLHLCHRVPRKQPRANVVHDESALPTQVRRRLGHTHAESNGGLVGGWIDGCTDCVDGWMAAWMDRWMDRWEDGWMAA